MSPLVLLIVACAASPEGEAARPPPAQAASPERSGVHHPDPGTRGRVVAKLLEGDRGSPAQRILWELHRPGDSGERAPDASLAERIEVADREVLARSLGEHLEDPSCPARPAMALALGRLAPPLALHRLLPHLDDGDVEVRRATAIAVGRVPVREAAGPLIEALSDRDPDVRAAAVDALVRFDGAGVAAGEIRAAAEELARHEDAERRALGLEFLWLILGPEARDDLLSALEDPANEVRAVAITAIGGLGDRTLGEEIAPFLKDPDPEIREAAAAAMGGVGTSKQVIPLTKLLRDDVLEVRLAAISSLGMLRDGRALVGLLALLDEDDAPEEVAASAWALGRIGDRRAVEPLIDLVGQRDDPDVRFAAVGALGSLRSEKAVEPLIGVLNDPDPEMKKQAAMALGQIGEKAAGEAVVYLLRGERQDVRIVALKAIGLLEYDPAARVVKAEIESEDAAVSYFAAATLFRLGDRAGAEVLREAFPRSLDLLRSDSREERLQGIDRVAYLAGEDFGYNPSGPAGDREAAIEAIRRWWEDLEARLSPGGGEEDRGERREDQDPEEQPEEEAEVRVPG